MKKELKEKLLLITYGVVLFVFISDYKWIFTLLGMALKVVYPFFLGGIIAYVINVLVKMVESKSLRKMKRFKRVTSIAISLLLIFGFMFLLIAILIPQIENASKIFIDNLPKYQETINVIGKKIGMDESEIGKFNLDENFVKNIVSKVIIGNDKNILDISVGFASSLYNGVVNAFISIVFAIYLLMDKESITKQFKKLYRKIVSNNVYNRTLDILKLTDVTFTNFIKVQVLEAFILGLLCFIGMLIFGFPYAGTISVVVGFTALVPIIGAFVGVIVGAFLIFMVSPVQALTFFIFFEILQQLENNFIYPRVVGNKVGLPSIWVLVAVTIGGTLFGVLGMLIGVPLASVIYSLLKVFVNRKEVTIEEK